MTNDECNCSLNLEKCPDQNDLVDGSQYPGMSCEAIARGLVLMRKRIEGNGHAYANVLNPLDQGEHVFITQKSAGIIAVDQMIQLK